MRSRYTACCPLASTPGHLCWRKARYLLFVHAPNYPYIFSKTNRILFNFYPTLRSAQITVRHIKHQQLCDFTQVHFDYCHQLYPSGNSYHIAKLTRSGTSLLWLSHKSEVGMIRHGKSDKIYRLRPDIRTASVCHPVVYTREGGVRVRLKYYS